MVKKNIYRTTPSIKRVRGKDQNPTGDYMPQWLSMWWVKRMEQALSSPTSWEKEKKSDKRRSEDVLPTSATCKKGIKGKNPLNCA